MYIQVIQGTCSDEEALRRQFDQWREDLAPGADGWLGWTCGVTDTGEFVGVVRFDSRDAAQRNSDRPEQGEWWERTSRCFDGEPDFHDCDDVVLMLDGGSDDAGFVQVIEGRAGDASSYREWVSQPMDELREMRPEIYGGTVAIDADGWFAQTMGFRSEEEARAGESKEMPPEAQQEFERQMSQVSDLRFLDLRHPWFATNAG